MPEPWLLKQLRWIQVSLNTRSEEASCIILPIALSVVGVTAPDAEGVFSSFSIMVEVEGDRAKALRGPKWVSLSSVFPRLGKHLIREWCAY